MTQPAPEKTAPVRTRRARSNCLWGVIGALGCLILLIVVLILAAGAGISAAGDIIASIREQFIPVTFTPIPSATLPPTATLLPSITPTGTPLPSPSPTPDLTQGIVTNVQLLGQLVSVSWQLAQADIGINVRQGVLDAASFSVQHAAQGTIEAGIDLSRVTAASVLYDPATNTYTITLPPAQLTSCRVDYIDQYGYGGTLLPVDLDAARQLANYVAVNGFRADALEDGILLRAQQQASLVISNFVRALTGSSAQVAFAQMDVPLPASCLPEAPIGWIYNAAENVWTRTP